MGTHPTDLGHSMIAAYYAEALPPILAGEVTSDEAPSLRLAARSNETPVAAKVTTDRHRFNNIASKDTSDVNLMVRSDTPTNGNLIVDNTTLDAPAGCDLPDSIVWTVARTGKLSLRLHSVNFRVGLVAGSVLFWSAHRCTIIVCALTHPCTSDHSLLTCTLSMYRCTIIVCALTHPCTSDHSLLTCTLSMYRCTIIVCALTHPCTSAHSLLTCTLSMYRCTIIVCALTHPCTSAHSLLTCTLSMYRCTIIVCALTHPCTSAHSLLTGTLSMYRAHRSYYQKMGSLGRPSHSLHHCSHATFRHTTPTDLTVGGRAEWDGLPRENFYDRFPLVAKGNVTSEGARRGIWGLSKCSAGECVALSFHMRTLFLTIAND
jgi:hypothetical protein